MNEKKILVISSNPIIKDLEPDFVNYLKEEKNFYIIFIVPTNEDKKFYNKFFPNLFDEIKISSNEYESIKQNYSEKFLVEETLNIERKLGSSIYRLFLADRVVGRGFHASGGFKHPKIRLHENSTSNDILKIAFFQVKFWDDLLKRKGVCLAINLPNIGHVIAQNYKINAQRIQEARFEKRHYWTSDLYFQMDHLEKIFDKFKNKNFKKVNINTPQHGHMMFRKKVHEKQLSFFSTFKDSFLQILRRYYGTLRGYRKAKNIYALDEFKYIWRRRRDFKKLQKLASIKSKDLKNIQYIYFPLSTEPEVALHGIATDFFFQLSAINMLARDLPVNYKIIVKEHLLAIGRRPTDFYNQILELKNVIMADPIELGISFIKESSAIACITGTAAWEALSMGIPVISFSKNNGFNFLDHAFYVDNPDDTHEILQNICSNKWPNSKSIRDGAQMYASYISNSIETLAKDTFISWKENNKRQNPENHKIAKTIADHLLSNTKVN